jgi:hypothetical protein
MKRTANPGHAAVISILALVTYEILYLYRAYDDNRLTSWKFAFYVADFWHVFFILIAGIAIAYLLSRVSPPVRFRALFLFFVSYAAAAVFWQEPELIVDASRYFTQAKHLELYGVGYFLMEWGGAIHPWTDLPAVPFLYGLIFRFAGESRIAVQAFITLLFSLTVVITYFIGKRLWDEDMGFYAGLLILGIPYLFSQVPLMLVDVPSMFFLTSSIYIFITALDRGGKNILMAALAVFFTFFAKYSTWLMLSVLAVIFFVHLADQPSSSRKTSLFRAFFVAVFSTAMIVVVVFLKLDVFKEQIDLLINYQKPGLERWGESFISTFFFQVHPFITLAAVYSVIAAVRKKDLKYLVLFWLPALIIFLQIKRIRYTIMVFPMLSLMASYGLSYMRNREIPRFILLCAVSCSLVIAVFAYLPYLKKISVVNLQEAGEFVNTLEGKEVEVFTPATSIPVLNPAVSVPLFDLYTDKRICYKYRPAFFPEPDVVRKSALRFTWEYRNPAYYKDAPSKGSPVVIIDNERGGALPEEIRQKTSGLRRTRVFNTSEGIFGYQTLVTVYY